MENNMKIGILTAIPEETRAILRKAKGVEKSRRGQHNTYRCRIAGHDVTLFEAGMGMLNSGWAATAMTVEMPELMVSAGFGGGVLPGIKVGDVIRAERLLHWAGTGFEEVETSFYAPENVSMPLSGCFVTSDGILNKRHLVELLPNGINRPVVEMESAAVARVAAEHGIPFLGLRAISDPWDEELAFSIDEFCDESMRVRPRKVLATILHRPGIIPQLIRLALNSRKAARSLGRAMERLLQQL
jgi:adenosylhomocysteine nucleosidase